MGIKLSFNDLKSTDRLTCIVTVFGVLQFFFLTFMAALLYPGNYNFFEYYFSDLGALAARNGETNLISSFLFSVTLIVIDFALIPFWLIIRSLFTESSLARTLSTAGSALGLLSFPFIIGVALFPMDTQLEAHFLSTMVFFSLFVLATLLYSMTIISHRDYHNLFGIVGVVLFAVSLLIFIDPLAPHVAFVQTIVCYGYFIWVLMQVFLVWSSTKNIKN